MEKLKVLMLGPGIPNPGNSGLGVAAYHIAAHLGKLVDITLIQPENDKLQVEEETHFSIEDLTDTHLIKDVIQVKVKQKLNPYFHASADEVEEVYVHEDATTESDILKAVESYSAKVVAEGQELDFDIIYAHDWISFTAAQRIKRATGKPLIVHIHTLEYDRSAGHTGSWIYHLERETLHLADSIIAVSEYTAGVIESHYGIDKNIHVVHNGYQKLEKPTKVNKPFPEKLVIFVGRISSQKGPAMFIDIAEAVHQKMPETRFVMAGDGELLKELIESGAYRSVSGKFHFTGRISTNQISELYAMADVFCMPSVSEPFGLSAIEAASFGVPVVVSKQSGAAEVLEGALTADYHDTAAFVDKVLLCLTDRKVVAKSTAANTDSLQFLDWQVSAQSILRVMRDTK